MKACETKICACNSKLSVSNQCPPLANNSLFIQFHMGICGEDTAQKYNISRLDQDEYAKKSYRASAEASESGIFDREIVPVSVPQKRGKPDMVVKQDEEYLR